MYNGFWLFYQELKDEFGEGTIPTLLLLLLTTTYPLLAELGFKILSPVCVLVESERIMLKLAEIITGFAETHMLTLSEQPGKVEEYLRSSRYGILLFRFAAGRYTRQNMEAILSDCQSLGRPINEETIKVIVSMGSIPKDYADLVEGVIFIKSNEKGINIGKAQVKEFLYPWIKFCLGHIPEIKKAGRKWSLHNQSGCCLQLTAEILLCFLQTEDHLSEDEEQRLTLELQAHMKQIEEEWQNAEEPEAYAKAFQRELYASSKLFLKALDREHLEGNDIPDIEESLLFDERFYYLKNDKFEELCKTLNENVGFSYVKCQLANAGVIVCGGGDRKYFTQQTELVTVYGGIIQRRLVKIYRSKIDGIGEVPLKDYLLMTKGEEDIGRDEVGQYKHSDRQGALGENCPGR